MDIEEPSQDRLSPSGMAYPEDVTSMHSDTDFAQEAGERIQQAMALCAFASQLVGKANDE